MMSHFEVTRIESCLKWLKELFSFSMEHNIRHIRVSKIKNTVFVTMKINSKEHEEIIKQKFPFNAKFRKTIRLSSGGTILAGYFEMLDSLDSCPKHRV